MAGAGVVSLGSRVASCVVTMAGPFSAGLAGFLRRLYFGAVASTIEGFLFNNAWTAQLDPVAHSEPYPKL